MYGDLPYRHTCVDETVASSLALAFTIDMPTHRPAQMTEINMYCARDLVPVGSCHCVLYHQRRVGSTGRRTLVFCGALEYCCTMQTFCCVVYARYSLKHLYRSSSHISPRMQAYESRTIALTDSPCQRPRLKKCRDTEDLLKQLASGRGRPDANHVTRFVTKHLVAIFLQGNSSKTSTDCLFKEVYRAFPHHPSTNMSHH